MASEPVKRVEITYEVPSWSVRWELDDNEPRMPENPLQVAICDLLKLILAAWCRRRGADALVSGNVAVRWDAAHPRVGVDPDVYLVEPAPPLDLEEKSVRTWVEGHHPPRVCVEVVGEGTAREDYRDKPEKYAASGTRELWVFDPLLRGMPGTRRREAFRLQVWRRVGGQFRRVYAGEGPAFSEELGAWLVVTDGRRRLRIADDPDGAALWPTPEEEERAAKEEERAAKERAMAEAQAARDEVERLRAEIARLRNG